MSPSKPGSDLKPSVGMSSPIHVPAHRPQSARHSASSSWSSSASSSYASTPSISPSPAFSSSTLTKGKSPATEVVVPALTCRDQISPRRPSLLGIVEPWVCSIAISRDGRGLLLVRTYANEWWLSREFIVEIRVHRDQPRPSRWATSAGETFRSYAMLSPTRC